MPQPACSWPPVRAMRPSDMATVAPPGTDTRFTAIEDAAALLRLLPAAEHIAWPVDAGDVIAVDEALRLIAGWLPVARKSWNLHRSSEA